jgi:hypothetical protein
VAHALQVQVQSGQARRDRRVRVRLLVAHQQAGRWYAISKRRAFRVLMPGLIRELGYLEVTGRWPAD